MTVLAVIPARGGSKGIPGKHLRRIAGRSLVEWSIAHALEAPSVDRVIVTTDSEEIRAQALAAGAEAPFLRPAELAGDDILDQPVFEHTLRWLETEEGGMPETLVHLRPTSPFRRPGWIDAAVAVLHGTPEADAVRSVSEVTQHPYRVFEIDEAGMLLPIMLHRHENPPLLRRQELPPMYYYNCVIDVTRAATVLEKQSMTGDRLAPWIMSADEVIDIDNYRDIEFADWFMNRWQA